VLAAGLPPAYAAAADDAAWDEGIRRSMAEAFAAVGQGVGTPALVLHRDPPVGVLGPLVSPPPTGADAVRLWDAVAALAGVPGCWRCHVRGHGGPWSRDCGGWRRISDDKGGDGRHALAVTKATDGPGRQWRSYALVQRRT
jgi:hypothetical protein